MTAYIQIGLTPSECSKSVPQVAITSDWEGIPLPLQYRLSMPDPGFYEKFKEVRKRLAFLPSHTAPSVCEEFLRDLQECGIKLHDTIFEQVKEPWYDVVNRGRGSYVLHAEPSLWKLPWELLYHYEFEYLDKLSTPIVRWLGRFSYPPKATCLDNPSIYFVGADPIDHATRADDQYEKLKSQIPGDVNKAQILVCNERDPKNETPQWERIVDDLRTRAPDVLHIVAHGKGEKGLAIEGRSRYEEVVIRYEDLTELLVNIRRVKLLIVAACGSSVFFEDKPYLARQLFDQTELKAVVLMASDISAEALIKFTELFYKALWDRADVAYAVAYARSMLRSQKPKPISLQWSVPMLYESSSLNPFGKWISEVRDYTSGSPLPFERLEATQAEARGIYEEVSKLAKLRQQAHPASSSIIFTTTKLKQAYDRYKHSVSMFDRRYAPEDEFLLDSIRVTSSKVLPIIDRFVQSATGWVDSNKAIAASENLVANLDEAVNLVLLRASREFQSWIES